MFVCGVIRNTVGVSGDDIGGVVVYVGDGYVFV